MAKKKILTDNGQEILPITHESCVLDNNGVSIGSKIGNINELATDSRTDLVSAINDILEFNNETKEQLKEVLIANGVEIGEGESWESIIGKLNSIQTGGSGLNVKVVTELPTSGEAGVVYVISDNPVENVVIGTTDDYDGIDANSVFIELTTADTATKQSQLVETTTGYTKIKYYFVQTLQNNKGLDSYIYENDDWRRLTIGEPIYLLNGNIVDRTFFGDPVSGFYWKLTANSGLVLSCSTSLSTDLMFNEYGVSLNNLIDFTRFNKLILTIRSTYTSTMFPCEFYIGGCSTSKGWTEDDKSLDQFVKYSSAYNVNTTTQTISVDISSWTGEMYLGFLIFSSSGSDLRSKVFYIENLKLTY